MITRYRTRAVKRLALSGLLIVLIPLLVGLRAAGLPDAVVAVGAVLLGTFALVVYVQGNIALAEAKGYDSSVVAAIIHLPGRLIFCHAVDPAVWPEG
jgi:Na+/H+-translocating membrane pyrophosphatase